MALIVARDFWRVPGLLSLIRIPLGLVFIAVSSKPPAAIGVLLLAAASDVADGWYARRFGQETPTGKVLDPIADKIFIVTVIVSLLGSNTLSLDEALLLGVRELCEMGLLLDWILFGRRRPRPVRGANRLGKAATVMQLASVVAILLGSHQRRLWVLATALCGLLAGLNYGIREWRGRQQQRRRTAG